MLDDPYRAIVAPVLEAHAGGAELPVRLPANLVAVPIVKQVTDFSCGAAATLAMLRLWRWETYAHVEETDLHAALQTTGARGTEPEPIAEYLRVAAHLRAEYRHGDVTLSQLQQAIDRGEPPIVDLQAWRDRDRPWRETWDAGHYVVLVGYDAERLFVMDPSVLTPGALRATSRRPSSTSDGTIWPGRTTFPWSGWSSSSRAAAASAGCRWSPSTGMATRLR